MPPPADPEFFDVPTWLQGIGLPEYVNVFLEQRIGYGDLLELTDGDLVAIGIDKMGPRRTILREVARLINERSAGADQTPAPPPIQSAPAPILAATILDAPIEPGESNPGVSQPKLAPAELPGEELVAQPAGGQRRKWQRRGSGFLLISIAVHVLFGIFATYLVVQTIAAKRKLTFQGGQKGPNPSTRALEHKVSMQKKKSTGGAPAQAKRITTTGLAKVALPAMPAMPGVVTEVKPGQMSGMGGSGSGLGNGIGSGSGFGGGGGGLGGGGAGLSMFGLREGRDGLVGTFYDLKQTPEKKPSSMAGPSTENSEKMQLRRTENNEYIETVKSFVRGFNEGSLKKYFQAPQKLVAHQICIPTIAAQAAPAAFGVEKECQGRRWIVHYKAEIIPPKDGTFRFVGRADDILVVRCRGRNVLDASFPAYPIDPTMNTENSRVTNVFNKGKWIEMRKGEPLLLELIIGETPGGHFFGYLCIEEKGAEYPPGTYSVFQLKKQDLPPKVSFNAAEPMVFGVKSARSPLSVFAR